MKPRIDLITIPTAALLLWSTWLSCGPAPTAGIETTNGDGSVTATVSAIQGTAPAYSRITVAGADYTPLVDNGSARVTAVGKDGAFRFAELAPGLYSLVIASPDDRRGAFVQDLRVGADTAALTRAFVFDNTGTIAGRVESAADTSVTALVYLAATAFYTVLTPPDSFTLGPVPPGTYALRTARLSTGMQQPQILDKSNAREVKVAPGGQARAGTLLLPP